MQSKSERHPRSNRYNVAVSRSSSPNRRVLVAILVAVTLVVVVGLASFIPIYVTRRGKDKSADEREIKQSGEDFNTKLTKRSVITLHSKPRSSSSPAQEGKSHLPSSSASASGEMISKASESALGIKTSVSSSPDFEKASATVASAASHLHSTLVSTAKTIVTSSSENQAATSSLMSTSKEPAPKVTSTVSKQHQTPSLFSILSFNTVTSRISFPSPISSRSELRPTSTWVSQSVLASLLPNTESKWSRWNSWSDCTKTCGSGTRYRNRTCVASNQEAFSASISCSGKFMQTRSCAEWECPDCNRTCIRGTLNAACDACTCLDHVLTGRVKTQNDAPLTGARISLSMVPYIILAQTNASGFFIAFNVCADVNQELLITKEGFVPVKIKPTVLTSTTAEVKASLETAVPPFVTVHPESKMRISGQGVKFCCDGGGNPFPEIEWFKDGNIIDDYANNTLEISNVSGMSGSFRCRVVNDYGSEFSDVASLEVFSAHTSNDVSCNKIPRSKNSTLPPGCVKHGTTSNVIDTGQCLSLPCIRNDSKLSNMACGDTETFCCGVEEVEDIAISCGGSAIFNISRVTRCGCQECSVPKSYISGIVVGIKGAVETPVRYCEIKIAENIFYNADDKGIFTVEVPNDKRRLSVVFSDVFDLEYEDLTKVFRIRKGQTSFVKVVMKEKPVLMPFNSSEPFNVTSAFAQLEIPHDALLKDDGTLYSGRANLRMSLIDSRNRSDVIASPGDFSTVDEDGEEQLLVTYGMLRLDFEGDNAETLSLSKPIKMFLDPEELNILVDSNGNTTTKLWWLDEMTGRWIKAGDLWLETKDSNSYRSKRSPRRFLVTEITPVIQKQRRLNIDVEQNFGAVRVSAPAGSTIRVLCKEPKQKDKYAGYLEENVNGFGVTCISVWINRLCYMQGENNNAQFLKPLAPDSFPVSVSATIVQSQMTAASSDSESAVESFQFEIKTNSRGPVYPHFRNDLINCRATDLREGHRQFQFVDNNQANLDFISSRPPNPETRNPLSWYPVRPSTSCFIKILMNGGKGSVYLAASYRANMKDEANKFGDSVAMAEPVNDNVYIACLEIRCPGDVYQPDLRDLVPEWTHVRVTHLTGTCAFQKNNLPKQDNIDNKNTECPSNAGGSENWFCIPLSDGGGFRVYTVFTAPRKNRKLAFNRCRTGRNDYSAGLATPSSNTATIEFSCS